MSYDNIFIINHLLCTNIYICEQLSHEQLHKLLSFLFTYYQHINIIELLHLDEESLLNLINSQSNNINNMDKLPIYHYRNKIEEINVEHLSINDFELFANGILIQLYSLSLLSFIIKKYHNSPFNILHVNNSKSSIDNDNLILLINDLKNYLPSIINIILNKAKYNYKSLLHYKSSIINNTNNTNNNITTQNENYGNYNAGIPHIYNLSMSLINTVENRNMNKIEYKKSLKNKLSLLNRIIVCSNNLKFLQKNLNDHL